MRYNFVEDYTKAQRDTVLSLRNALASKADGTAWATADFDRLKKLTLDAVHQLIDEPQTTADNREAALNVDPADLSYQFQITDSPGPDYYPAWGPHKIVFASLRTGDNEIFVVDNDGTNVVQITSTPGFHNYAPDWAPDGSKIVFTSTRGGDPAGQIHMMNPDGTNVVNLGYVGTQARYSRDGQKICFISGMNGAVNVFSMNPDGSGLTQITNESVNVNHPAWSPDRSQVLFSQPTGGGGSADIFKINVNGTGKTQLTTHTGMDREPDWRPDGSKIVFSTNRDGQYELYSMAPDGTSLVRITNNSGDDQNPRYSKDGSEILCNSSRTGVSEIYVIAASGKPLNPEYRHEFMMTEYSDYHAAWAYDYVASFRVIADEFPVVMSSVGRGNSTFPYKEREPGIVRRSLARHGYRELDEGETPPPEIVGKYGVTI